MVENCYKGKKILVTGGVGSIGSQLVRKLLTLDPAIVRVLDNNETGLFDLEQDLHSNKIRTLVGDIRDKERLIVAMDGIDFVFHSSALKHVPLCEYNPFDAVKTNVLGTQNVLEAALTQEVGKVINISTDKAVNPTNVMGATKLLTERLTISANYYRGNKKTIFSSVRFGNVLNSRGSVIPLFRTQIQNGGPVTVTDKDMTRFFMDIPSAANLILTAGEMAQGREIFILKMPSLNIFSLAQALIRMHSSDAKPRSGKIKIKIVGKRNGEKINEELMTEEESTRACENKDLLIILPHILPFEESIDINKYPGMKKVKIRKFSSDSVGSMTVDEIIELLKKLEPLEKSFC
jgi:FlaA1/EpsC-like NDP-sugar epimerase